MSIVSFGAMQTALDAVVADHETRLEGYRALLNDKQRALQQREQKLERELQGWEEAYKDDLERPDKKLRLNVAGLEMRVFRKVLTCVKDTHLARMFSGRWEKHLQRDQQGRVFLDVDAEAFRCLLTFLMAMDEANPEGAEHMTGGQHHELLSRVEEQKQDVLTQILWLFGFMRPETPAERPPRAPETWAIQEFSGVSPEVETALEDIRKALQAYESSLDDRGSTQAIEKAFMDQFASGEIADVVGLNLMGQPCASKRSTLRLSPLPPQNQVNAAAATPAAAAVEAGAAADPGEQKGEQQQAEALETFLSRKFDDSVWDLNDDYMESDPHCFAIVLNQLRMIKWQRMRTAEGAEGVPVCHGMPPPPPPSVPPHLADKYSEMVKLYFPGCEDFVGGTGGADSLILDYAQQIQICRWLPRPISALGECLWRGSRDGFAGSTFHQRCNGKANTVTVVRDSNGNVFGGFAGVVWRSKNRYSTCTRAFTFSLVRTIDRGGVPLKLGCTNTGMATYNRKDYGPSFGGGHDIHIANGCNANNSSCTNMVSFGPLPAYPNNSVHFMSGNVQNFVVSEVEVFATR